MGNSDSFGGSVVEETEEDFDSLFEQETIYRHSKMIANLTFKSSL